MSQTYHTIKDWNVPKDGAYHIFIDAWWIVDDDGNPLFHSKHNSPQCNRNKAITDRLANGRRVEQLPIVYSPVRFQDYID